MATVSADQKLSPSSRAAILQNLVSLAAIMANKQVEEFSLRLEAALLNVSELSLQPAEADVSFNAFNFLRLNRPGFARIVADRIQTLLTQEVRVFGTAGKSALQADGPGLSSVTFDDMQVRTMAAHAAESLASDTADILDALNLRLAWLAGREEVATADNPFRPYVFVQAIYQSWCKFSPEAASHPVVLRLLGPELFLSLGSILRELDRALVERNVMPDLTEALRLKKTRNKMGLPTPRASLRDTPRYNKVRAWLMSDHQKVEQESGLTEEGHLNIPDLFSPDGGATSSANHTISGRVGPRVFGYLNNLQRQITQLELAGQLSSLAQSTSLLRKSREQMPPGTLTHIDDNTFELVARIFDFIGSDQEMPAELKRLIGQLMIPFLKTALVDKKIFVNAGHPAAVLMDKLAQAGIGWGPDQGRDDPLYVMLEKIVMRVQIEFDRQAGMFGNVLSELESSLAEEEKLAAAAVARPIAEALKQENTQQAQAAARHDIALRIETGEVAGFVETFLLSQWLRILTYAHSVHAQKPEVLAKALTVMDDLIWSVQPKHSAEQRKELLTRLPSLLALINSWLNAIKWDAPERAEFFASLAQRHATIVRIQTELSARHQVEIAVNVAEKATEHRMMRRYRREPVKTRDQFTEMVDHLEQGTWLNFPRNDGEMVKFRLVWISPQRSRFIFANRRGQNAIVFTDDEMAQALRTHKAGRLVVEPLMERVMAAALDNW
ncbi:MAG: DUF1631 family protein [Pseudomonadota bacterium]